MPKYELKSEYWDGERLFPKGSVVEFKKGEAPSNSVPVAAKEADTSSSLDL